MNNNNVTIVYKLKGEIITGKSLESKKILFNPKCFISNELTQARLNLVEKISKNQTATLFVNENLTFEEKIN